MKEFNKVLYYILLKIESSKIGKEKFQINDKLVLKYFNQLKDPKNSKFIEFESYFLSFFNFCFEISLNNMIREAINFKY